MGEFKMKWKYIVWVGGVDDYYTNYEKAKKHYNEWIKKGYDDVILETVSEKIGIKTDTTIST
tara:strand:+ start:556 stop:741 length:186 start_codon:yes stop_codon:yes gene_type:complete